MRLKLREFLNLKSELKLKKAKQPPKEHCVSKIE